MDGSGGAVQHLELICKVNLKTPLAPARTEFQSFCFLLNKYAETHTG